MKEIGCLEYKGYTEINRLENDTIKELEKQVTKLATEVEVKDKKISNLETRIKKYYKNNEKEIDLEM